MNHLKIYCNLIRKAENRTPPEGYTEKHHVFPLSIYGKNNRIVVLTGREHYIAHALLEKICIKRYGLNHWKTKKMNNAFILMKIKNLNYNSYLYESARIRRCILTSGENHPMYGKKHSQQSIEKMINTRSSMDKNIWSENSRKAGEKTYQLGLGIHERTKEQMTEDGKKGAQMQKEMGTGVWELTPEQRTQMGKNGGKKGGKIMGQRHYEEGTGIFSLSLEEKLENCSKGGLKTSSQKWMCTETGYITTPGPLTVYQRKRGIDTSKRVRLT
jgi:hypothetical protein